MASGNTCWTCRLRKKRCDKNSVPCGACQVLGITCYTGDERPAWMDGSRRQTAMANRVRAEIRQNAQGRRERQSIRVFALQEQPPAGEDAGSPSPPHSPLGYTPRKNEPGRLIQGLRLPMSPISHSSAPADDDSTMAMLGTALSLLPRDIGTKLEMNFLDHVFPFLFPFYRPSIIDGGRGWLMAALKANKSLFHTAMSLSMYFMVLIFSELQDQQRVRCKHYIWEQMADYMEISVKAMLQETKDLYADQENLTVYCRARVMEGIIQLLIFELSVLRTAHWNVHLSAAMSMFCEIFRHYGMRAEGQPDMDLVITAMDRSCPIVDISSRGYWNLDQGAFRFYTAILLYIDVVASTVLERPPQLRSYHAGLFSCETGFGGSGNRLRMQDYIGCQSWVILLVAETSTLNAHQKDGSISYRQAKLQGQRISQKLDKCMAAIEANKSSVTAEGFDFLEMHDYHGSQGRTDSSLITTGIWGHAARIYLLVVTSGWQPEHSVIRNSVESIIGDLEQVTSPAILRNLAWPICVAGCLSTESQEPAFKKAIRRMGPLLNFGTLGVALRIMERVWQMRGKLNQDSWDLAQCFKVLGSGNLLI